IAPSDDQSIALRIQCSELESKLALAESSATASDAAVKERDTKIAELTSAIEDVGAQTATAVEQRDKEIADLNAKIADLEDKLTEPDDTKAPSSGKASKSAKN
ncbi:MAG: hypothetical protein KC983_05510, partial [Phycisphaerales bacterium]|nr:hypothetical protein [Phycisphaerales bacterium]